MDKETVKRLAFQNDTTNPFMVDFKFSEEGLIAFAQACFNAGCAAQIEKDAQECERMMMYPGGRCEASAHNTVWDAAQAIRNAKDD